MVKPLALVCLVLLLSTACSAVPETPVLVPLRTPAAAPSPAATATATATPTRLAPIARPPTASPTPTYVIGAVEATPTETPVGNETWKGLMQSTGELPVPNNPCHDAFNTLIELTVAPDGSVSGKGEATATVPAACAIQPKQPPVTAVTIRIEGQRSSDRFELRLFPDAVTGMVEAGFFANWMGPSGVEPPVQIIPIVRPGRAEGVVETTDASRFKAGTTHNVYQLDCTNC